MIASHWITCITGDDDEDDGRCACRHISFHHHASDSPSTDPRILHSDVESTQPLPAPGVPCVCE